MMVWSNEQVEWWRGRQKAYLADNIAVERDKLVDLQRIQAQQEMLQSLNSFLDGKLSLKQFNAVFQQRTNDGWGAFHLRGMSGGLFFNKLVKYVPNEETFAHLFRLMILAPEEVREAQQRLQAFTRFVEGLISSERVQRAQLQPARVPFFLSIWWHIQALERWPIYYGNVRQALMVKDQLNVLPTDPGDSYLAFRTRFLALAQALDISLWEVEHLCKWSLQQSPPQSSTANSEKQVSGFRQGGKQTSPRRQTCIRTARAEASHKTPLQERAAEQVIGCRTHLQWLLAKIGHKVGCCVWIASSDQDKACNNERLGDLSLHSLPILADSTFQKVISKIDVLWIKEQEVVAAYEIEQACTDVSISLLRLSDLRELFRDTRMNLCLVAPQDRFEKIQFELSRPAFQARAMQKHCALISEELLLEQEEHILRWATSPAIIEDLICPGDRRTQ